MKKTIERNLRKQGYLIVSVLLAIGALLAMPTASLEGMDQPQTGKIKFNHKFHVKESGLSCTDCHSAAPTSKLTSDNLSAKHENCQTCHSDQVEKNCTFCHTSEDVSTYVFENPARDLKLSHQSHIDGQKVECQTCHKDVEAAEQLQSVGLPSMATCNTCHNGVKATNACETCHTNFASLRPKEHNKTDFIREHKRIARISNATCMGCHTQETCADCHNGASLTKTTKSGKDMVSPRSPRLTAIDRGQGMTLSKVHDLNFRFTHGLAAQQKKQDCQTCHQEKTFCSTCHTAGGNVNQVSFIPATHSNTGGLFATVGVGSGGGKHAQMARRDIESCASCHDAQGADPTCISCHSDIDGVKGTDPRTHTRGFMESSRGEWHSDPGSSCFMCHTDANARPGGIQGQKFCGYCHK
jgi:hypothetical protein